MFNAYALNIKTNEKIQIGEYISEKSAWWDIGQNLEWDEGDNPEDWRFSVEEAPQIKCPNCGSTAQVKLTWEERFGEKDTKYTKEFKCGCGCTFEAIYKLSELKILK